MYGVVNPLRKTLCSGNKGKEDAAETIPDAELEAADNNSVVPLVDRYCFLQGNRFCRAGDTICIHDVLPALEAGQEVTESKEKIVILWEQLCVDDTQTQTSTRNVLQAMERLWPSLADNPVYPFCSWPQV